MADVAAAEKPLLVLWLYVAGASPRSMRAIARTEAICKKHFPGAHTLHVIDIYKDPERARGDDIIAVPTLVISHPPPARRIVGEFADEGRIVVALVQPTQEEPREA